MRSIDKKVILGISLVVATILVALLIVGIILRGIQHADAEGTAPITTGPTVPADAPASSNPPASAFAHPVPSEDDYSNVVPEISAETRELVGLAALRLGTWEAGQTISERQTAVDGLVPTALVGESPFAAQFEGAPINGAYVTTTLAGDPAPGGLSNDSANTIAVMVQVECTIHLPKGHGSEAIATTIPTWTFQVDTSHPSAPTITAVIEPVNP